jgi:fructosamine-3-kinase
MKTILQKALRQLMDEKDPPDIHPVSGGSINQTFRIDTAKRSYFAKINRPVPETFFQKEINGLTAIKQTNTLSVPDVYGTFYEKESQTALLLLEWIEGTETPATIPQLGRGLARLHQVRGQAFGFHEDNLIGTLPQRNAWMADWRSFYRDQRLKVQYELGIERQTITGTRRKKLESLMNQLERWIPGQVQPSLIHGDLWGGNWITGPDGSPFLIDPAVFFAHHELEIAFTELFGGFPASFYDYYQEVYPLSPSYPERKPLYQLYYLLVHLNVFGESYGHSVDRILNRYVG